MILGGFWHQKTKPIKANFPLNQAPYSLPGLFGGLGIQVLELEKESVRAADAVKG